MTAAEKTETFAAINAGLRDGYLKPIIGNAYSLVDAPKAHIDVMEHSNGSSGKIVIHPWE
jgi:NADPH:quinone reductase-like Zn-dependent oxidoreductase